MLQPLIASLEPHKIAHIDLLEHDNATTTRFLNGQGNDTISRSG